MNAMTKDEYRKLPKNWQCPCGQPHGNCICGSYHLAVGEPCRRTIKASTKVTVTVKCHEVKR